ncbi:MAG: hypothetical protein JOZ29_01465 [Deltaproteobacteria bacterium]|nr:hypothetical protein [Deltaproteobacteria bacterium]
MTEVQSKQSLVPKIRLSRKVARSEWREKILEQQQVTLVDKAMAGIGRN